MCSVVISGCAIGSAILLARIASGVITDPATHNVGRWVPLLSILLAVWAVRAGAHWFQARLGQRGASAVIADLSGQVLTAVTAQQPSLLAAERDAAAAVVTRGLDALRPYFTAYLPALLLAAILTPVEYGRAWALRPEIGGDRADYPAVDPDLHGADRLGDR